MGASDGSTSDFIVTVAAKIQTILEQQDLHAGIRDVLETALRILELLAVFETNKMDILFTGLLVAQIAQCVADCLPSSEWTDQQIWLLKTALENLLSYLEVIEEESSRWKDDKTDEIIQIARSDEFSIDLSKHKEELENAALVLQLKLQAHEDVKLNETNDSVLNLVYNLRGVGDIMENIEQNMDSNISKLDAILEYAVQVQRSFDDYQRDVAMHNRPSDTSIFHSFQMLKDEVDREANKQRQSSRPFNSIEHIKKWMISSKQIEYNTEESIDRNEIATVYKGRYMGKNVAVKQFHGILNTDSADLERDVDREIRQWAKVSKLPFVSNLIGVCTKVSKVLIASEWCPETISTFLERRPRRLLPMIYELISGLASIHREGIIHGNLKAANVLVTEQNHVVITDFGLSKSVVTTMARNTSINAPVHMINWSSPDILFTARRAGPPADMWSFGMTVYELLAKDIPFKDYNKFEIQRAVKTDHERPPRPADLNPALYPLWNEIEKCWRKNPIERPTAREFQNFMEDHYSIKLGRDKPGDLIIHVHSVRGLRHSTQAVRKQALVEVKIKGQFFRTSPHENGHISPSWDEFFYLENDSDINHHEKVNIRVVTKSLMSVSQNEIAHTTLTLARLLEVKPTNNQEHNPEHKFGFRLNPSGRIVIDATIISRDDVVNSAKLKKIYMKHLCADLDDDDPDDPTTCVVGTFGAGKSSLINSILGESMCKRSIWGGCTQDVKRVGMALGLTLIDTPSYPFIDDQPGFLPALKKCCVAVIVFDRTIDEVVELVNKVRVTKCKMIFVRNKRSLLPHIFDPPDGPNVEERHRQDHIDNMLGTPADSIVQQDNDDIKTLFGLSTAANFYIDARAVNKARLQDGATVNKDLLDSWLAMLKAIRVANGNPMDESELGDFRNLIPTEESTSVIAPVIEIQISGESLFTANTNDSNDKQNGIYSIQSAIKLISEACDEWEASSSDIVKTATAIFKMSLEFKIHRVKVLKIGLTIERILRHMKIMTSEDNASNLLPALKNIEKSWKDALPRVHLYKLQLNASRRQEEFDIIGAEILRLHDELVKTVANLPFDVNVQVIGDIEDVKYDLGVMIQNMQCIHKYLDTFEKISNQSKGRDDIIELAIQMQRGCEHYERQVALGNFTHLNGFKEKVESCQQQIKSTIDDVRQTKKLPEHFCWKRIESWMLASKDISFDPKDESALLGKGGFGTVYKGKYQGQPVAIKQFDQITINDSVDLEKQISTEIKSWKKISEQPYILTLLGICTKTTKPIIVSELCETNIRRYVRDWPEELLPMVFQFACGLKAIHKAKIIHRDLKGDNVLVTFHKTVAIADFGLSRSVTSHESTRMTGAKGAGTLNWMSPEQYLRNRSVTEKSDVWSFGMTLWEILCNDTPLRECCEEEFKLSVFCFDYDRPEKPTDMQPYHEPLWTLITMCWQLEPEKRPSAADIVEFLETRYPSELRKM